MPATGGSRPDRRLPARGTARGRHRTGALPARRSCAAQWRSGVCLPAKRRRPAHAGCRRQCRPKRWFWTRHGRLPSSMHTPPKWAVRRPGCPAWWESGGSGRWADTVSRGRPAMTSGRACRSMSVPALPVGTAGHRGLQSGPRWHHWSGHTNALTAVASWSPERSSLAQRPVRRSAEPQQPHPRR